MRILIAEDDPALGASLRKGLERDSYAVDLATDGQAALDAALTTPYDLLILDVMLPRRDGFDVCRELRRQQREMPVLFLTARRDVESRITGLDLGADDYLTKPFAFRELEARVRALLRRESPSKTAQLTFLDLVLDTSTHEVFRGERPIQLSGKEFALLELFMRHPRQVLTRSMITDHVWSEDSDNFSNVIEVYVRYLRRKLCEDGEPDVIHTVRGIGYALREPVA
jgi:DNA-binding response OmpR family regulator